MSQVNILLVDDEPANLLVLEAVLGDLGQNLVKASSGEEALKRVLDTDFAAILLDVRMPTLSGFETARLIRSRPRSSRTPILFLTAFDEDGFAVEEAYALGAVDYLTKPVVPAVLRAKVAFFVELRRKTDELAQAERERHAAALGEKDERIRLILDNIRDYAFILSSPEGRVTEWEGGAHSITGWTAAEAIGQPAAILFTSEDRAAGVPAAEMLRARETGRASDKRWHVRKDGSRFFADGVMVPLNDATGRLRGFAKIFRDATAERKASDELRESRERFALLLDSSGEGIFGMGADGTCTFLNATAARMLGYQPDELVGHLVHDLIHHHHPDGLPYPASECRIGQAARTGTPLRCDDEVFFRKDGTPVPVSYSVNPMIVDGKSTGAVITTTDITERRRAEAERERLLREVQAASERMADVFRQAPAFMCVVRGPEHVFELVNDRYLALVGRRELVGKPVREALPELAGQVFLDRLDRVYQTGEAFVSTDGRVRLARQPDQPLEERFVDFVYLPLRDSDGAMSGILVHGVDLTERKRAQILAAGQQKALSNAVAGSPLPEILEVLTRTAEECAGGTVQAVIMLLDPDGKHLRLGAAPSLPTAFVRRIDGMAVGPNAPACGAAAYHGRRVVVPDLAAEPTWAELRQAALGQGLRSCWSHPILSSAGKVLGTFAFFYREVRPEESGEPEAMALLVSTAALVFDRHREARERKEAEERVWLATAAAELAVWVWEPETDRVTWENERGLEIFAMPRASEPITGTRFLTEFLHAADVGAFRRAIAATIDTGARFFFEGRIRRADAEQRWVEFTGRLQPADSGLPLRILGTAADITDRKKAEEGLRQLAADLSEADRRKTEFLATLAHELRNPLAPIGNGLQIMRLSAHDPATVSRARDMMERQLNHMVHLVNDLLDIARITRGKIELKKVRVDLSAVVTSAVETSMPAIEAAAHELVVRLPDEPLPVHADPTRLAQVLGNLLHNAAKYTPTGGRIVLAVRRDDDQVEVAVTDTGIGIPAESIATVFEMFTQVGRSLDRAQGGLGIGLTLVRRLVELHGGTVTATSPGAGKGSTFMIRMPMAENADKETPSGARPVSGKTAAAVRKFKVLVVDDNQDGADTLAALLEILGHTTRVANDGERALRVAKEFLPEVIFLDIGMPGMNGYEVARAVRKEPLNHGVVLVALTGWGAESDRARTREAGFDHHLTKPAELTAVEELLGRLSLRAGPPPTT